MNNYNEIPLLDLKEQYSLIKDEVNCAISRVLESQKFILGSEVHEFEQELSNKLNCTYAIGVSSGTDALLVALMALDIKPGDEVITTPYSFFATVGCIIRLGAIPVFADIDPYTFNIDVSRVESLVTDKTKAIIPVHLFGKVSDMNAIKEIGKKYKIFVVEDAAQAIGAKYDNLYAGTLGDIGCFSFFPSKNLGGIGDGGMVVTSNPDLAVKIKILRNQGASPKYNHVLIGGNFRLDEIQAAVLRVKLKYIDDWNMARKQNADRYERLFSEMGVATSILKNIYYTNKVFLPQAGNRESHVFNQYVIRINRRDELIKELRDNHIGHEIYYPLPLHRQPCLREHLQKTVDLSESERASSTSLAIPVYPEIKEWMQIRIAEVINGFMNKTSDS